MPDHLNSWRADSQGLLFPDYQLSLQPLVQSWIILFTKCKLNKFKWKEYDLQCRICKLILDRISAHTPFLSGIDQLDDPECCSVARYWAYQFMCLPEYHRQLDSLSRKRLFLRRKEMR